MILEIGVDRHCKSNVDDTFRLVCIRKCPKLLRIKLRLYTCCVLSSSHLADLVEHSGRMLSEDTSHAAHVTTPPSLALRAAATDRFCSIFCEDQCPSGRHAQVSPLHCRRLLIAAVSPPLPRPTRGVRARLHSSSSPFHQLSPHNSTGNWEVTKRSSP